MVSFNFTTPSLDNLGRTHGLEKGLVVVKDGCLLCEEGMGFGVPVVVKNLQTYLSFNAQTRSLRKHDSEFSEKTFFLDGVERVRFRGREINSPLHDAWVELRGLVYTKIKPVQKLLPAWDRATKKAGFEFFFKRVDPLAKIAVSYHITPVKINVQVDLTEFNRIRGKAKLFILNEQGANFFPRYEDSSGLSLKCQEIGPWNRVKADWAYFLTEDKTIRFGVEKQYWAGVKLYRGWELLPDSLAWAGLIYDLSGFREPVFNYSISLAIDR